MIPQEFIQTLLGRVDIVEVVGHYVPLKKAGSNYVARCPFHSEKTPSFSVSPAKQFYHCFGCGASGSALGFLMEYTGVGFLEAVHDLAQQAGLQVPEEHGGQDYLRQHQSRMNLGEIIRRALEYYRNQLKHSPAAINYLKRRGLTGSVAARFGLGYAPEGWRNLASVFSGYDAPELVEAGLVIATDDGKRYDRFRERIMFPIQDSRGEVIAFGGRVIESGEPKYLNSPETPLFEKGRELYGFSQARRAIREQGWVLVVEGYMDVVALSQAGIENAVATLGTATSAIHVQKLMRVADKVIFAFDGDAAGRQAARRAMEVALPYLTDNAQIHFLFLPEGEDPDSYVRSAGRDAFERLALQATPLSQFFLDALMQDLDMTSAEGKAQFLKRAAEQAPRIAAPALALLLRERIAELARLPREDVDRLLGGSKVAPTAASLPMDRRRRREPPTSMATRLLACVLQYPVVATTGTEPGAWVEEPDEQALRAVVDFVRISQAKGQVLLSGIVEHFRDCDENRFIQEALRREFNALSSSPMEEVAQSYKEGLARLQQQHRRRKVDRLLAKSRNEALTAEEMQILKALTALQYEKAGR